KDDVYSEVASYLHSRGIVAISVFKEIDTDELTDFFKFIKNDIKTIREKKGVLKNIPPTPHLQIKEIDYSLLLASAEGMDTAEEEEIWQFLTSVAQEAKQGKLPESKVEFLIGFLKDQKKSAAVLNAIYRKAVAKLEDDTAVRNIRDTIAKISSYFEGIKDGDSKEIREDLMQIIARLHPDLVAGLFDQTELEAKDSGFAKNLIKDFSDNFIADFIESLISDEGVFNENLLKVFDKLAPEENKAGGISAIITDKLFDKGLLKTDELTKLQMSVKEVFSRNPNSNFMSHIYRMTVDTFVNRRIDTLVYMVRLAPLISEYVRSVEGDKLRGEKVTLLLNLIWLEKDIPEFVKLCAKLEEIFPEILRSGDTRSIRQVTDLFADSLSVKRREDSNIDRQAKKMLDKFTGRDVTDRVISLIPEAGGEDLNDITDILVKTEAGSAAGLLDAFIAEKDRAIRRKFGSVLSGMDKRAIEDIVGRIEFSEPGVARELFGILKESDPERAHSLARKLIAHKDPRLRLEGLESFKPETREERNSVFSFFKKEKNFEVKEKAAAVLLKTGEGEVISGLFDYAGRGFFRQKLLLRIVELCGNMKTMESLPRLRRIFCGRVLFNTKRADELRVAAVVSLGRLRTDESIELIRRGLLDKRERVRDMCRIIVELEKDKNDKEAGADGAE
ncbi:MAG: hypothetical protein U9R44_07500, partial [Candidatus Omnitrophota bacterium]|nr:hypothetical protein [Candidatus Omnitrophota bacterium]